MKLVSLFIKGFGKFENFSYDFNEGLNSFCEANGYGKSTLLDFIKAMFYGMDTTRKDSFGERSRYIPYAAPYGGTLILRKGEDEFRIERTFDHKSAAQDQLKVYKNNVEEKVSDVGAFFFGVNKDSFERTLFTRSLDEICGTEEIQFKIGNFIDDIETSKYKKMIKSLDDKISVYQKSGARGGLIGQVKAEIQNVNATLSNAERNLAELSRDHAKKKAYEDLLKQAEREAQRAQEINLILEKRKVLERYEKEAEELKNRLDDLVSALPKGIPSDEEFSQASEKSELAEKAKINAEAYKREYPDLERSARLFSQGVPTDEEYARANYLLNEKRDLSLQSYPSVEILSYDRFNGKEPSSMSVETLKLNVDTYKNACLERGEEKSKKPVPALVLLMISILSIIGGASSIFFTKIVGIVLFAFGAICLAAAVGAFLILNQKQTSDKKAEDQGQRRLGAEIKAFLAIYGYVSGDLTADVISFERDLEDYLSSKAQADESARKETERISRINAIDEELISFFKPFGYVECTLNGLYEIKSAGENYLSTLAKKEKDVETAESYEKEYEALSAEVSNFLDEYAPNMSLNALKDLIYDSRKLKEDLLKTENVIASYKAANSFDYDEKDFVDQEAANAKLSELRLKLTEINAQIQEKESFAAIKEEAARDLEEKNAQLVEYEERFSRLSACKRLLSLAEKNMREKYVLPIKEKFAHFAFILGFKAAENIVFDDNLNLKYNINGSLSDVNTLSEGELNMISLCYRLSLIDNVFGEIPFIVIDDAFSKLDEMNFSEVATAIKDLARSVQIIYATCHSSRKI